MSASSRHVYEPAQGSGLPHDPFNAIVGPRPIGWISTLGADGVANLAPYSFFNAFNYRPPLIGFASIGWKDTAANAAATREFVWSLASRDLAEAMNATAAHVPAGVDEFELAGLTKAAGRRVQAPLVAEARVSFECRVSQIIQLTGADGAAVETWLILGEVVVVHIDPSLLKEGVYDTAGARPILRGGGWGDYAVVEPGAMFRMKRPA